MSAPALDPELLTQLVEPFTTAVTLTLREMVSAETFVRAVEEQQPPRTTGAVSAALDLRSAQASALVLSFPTTTAERLASQMLAGAVTEVSAELIQDCVGEIANIVGGQAKALLHGTPHQISFTTPRFLVGVHQAIRPPRDGERCLVITFASDLGEFALQLLLER